MSIFVEMILKNVTLDIKHVLGLGQQSVRFFMDFFCWGNENKKPKCSTTTLMCIGKRSDSNPLVLLVSMWELKLSRIVYLLG